MDRTLKRVAELVGAGDVESRCAALVVLTQLAADDAQVVEAAAQALNKPNVVVRDFALAYFESVRPKEGLDRVLPLLDHDDTAVRGRVAGIVASYGAAGVRAAKALAKDAPPRRIGAIVDICGRVRSDSAYDLLFQLMVGGDFETNRAAGEALESAIRDMEPRPRSEFLRRVEAFADTVKEDRVPLISAIKLFGALGDARARKRLFSLVDKDRPHAVRTHALGSLVQCLRGQALTAPEIERLLPLLREDDESGILRPAIALLEDQSLSREHLDELRRLADSPQGVVKRFAVHKLGAFDSGAVVKTLIGYLDDESYARRSEAAATLKTTPGARLPLMKELLACEDERRAWTLAEIVLAHDREWRKDVRDGLWNRLAAALDEREDRLYSPFLHVLRQLDEAGVLARVRERGEKLRRAKKYAEAARWLGQLRDTPAFDAEARFALAISDLKSRRHDVSSPGRRHDPALDLLRGLAGSAFALADRLRRERALVPEDLWYVGFNFAEDSGEARAVGRDILARLAAASGRTKVGKAAKNKLRLLG